MEDCGERHYCRGFCRVHYRRWRRHGDPLALKSAGAVTRERLQEHMAVRVEELLFLLSCGVAVTEALTRVGWTVGAARRWSYRHGRRDVLAALGGRA